VDLAEINDEILRFLFHDASNRNITIHKEIRDVSPVRIDPIQLVSKCRLARVIPLISDPTMPTRPWSVPHTKRFSRGVVPS